MTEYELGAIVLFLILAAAIIGLLVALFSWVGPVVGLLVLILFFK